MLPQFAGALKAIGAALPVSVRHQFTVVEQTESTDSPRTVTLDASYLALTESDYTCWEDFIRELTGVREAFEEIYRPADYTRLGLRYVNIIDRVALGLADVPWSELLNPSISGLFCDANVSGDVQASQAEHELTLTDVPDATVKLRHLLGVTEDDVPVYIIDTDISTIVRTNGQQVSGYLATFNRVAGDVFRWAVTPSLRKALLADDAS